jgi:hypothetical protein
VLTIAMHKLFGHGGTIRHVQALAEPAAWLVESNMPGSMPKVEIVATTHYGIGEIAATLEAEVVGGIPTWMQSRAKRRITRRARGAAGMTVLHPRGGVAVLLNIPLLHRSEDLAATLIHELTHAVQLADPRVQQRMVRHLSGAYGVAPYSRADEREHLRCMDAEEAEAYAMERLTPHLNSRAA